MANPVSYFFIVQHSIRGGTIVDFNFRIRCGMPFYVFSYLLRNLHCMLVGTKPGQLIKHTTPSVVLPNQSLRYSRP